MTDVSTAQTNAALPTTSAAKSIENNNETNCHATADTTTSSTKQVTTGRTISLANGSTPKINNTEKIPTTKRNTDVENLAIETTTNASKIKMSTISVKSPPTPTTQSPATTPNQTLSACSYNPNLTATSPSTSPANANQTNQLSAKPALQADGEIITPDTIAIITTHTSASASASPSPSPTISTGTTTCTSPCLKTLTSRQQLREATAQDVDEVARLFEEKPEAFEKWLMERAPPEALARLHEFIESRKQPPKRPSVTSDLFQQWMSSSSPIQVSGEICNFYDFFLMWVSLGVCHCHSKK